MVSLLWTPVDESERARVTLENADELRRILGDDPSRMGRVFARHAYGMERWVDLIAARIPSAPAERTELLAGLVADNARHARLFRGRARAHGIDPDAYVCPPEGEAVYARLHELTDLGEGLGYALGSLEHFDQLLGAYRESTGDADDAAAIDEVRRDVGRARRELLALVGPGDSAAAGEAHELYRRRELAETPDYARG
jgi:hypothetical protein